MLLSKTLRLFNAKKGHGTTTRQRKLYIHPPSIPTRFQTFVFDDGERRAFGSSAARFTRRLDELPGPGYYVVAGGNNGGPEKTPGLVSKSKRFPPPDASQPSPTHYTPHTTPVYSHSLTTSPSAAFIPSPHFQRSVSPSIPLWKARFEKPTPGPGSYDAERAGDAEQRQPRYRRRMAVFKSTSRRSEVNELGWTPGRDAPAPDAYSIQESILVKDVGGAIAAFRAVPRDSVFALSDTSTNPGPGTYGVRAPSPTQNSHYRPLWRPPPSQPLHHTPGPPAIPLTHLTSIPGSNAPPISNPGPGAYDVPAAAEHTSQRRRPADTKGSVFASATPRFAQSEASRQRGPGFYSPVAERGKRTFRLNLSDMWAC
ncbi:O(6)-methylguanine-induced apoptosis 2 [Geranomyces michiganensis]|nr:O(6)-methylguanine-induced apoptosis 2 [Geranomyces michiganensis]